MGKSLTAIGMGDVLTYATELEKHSGGKVSLCMWPKPMGSWHVWEVSALLTFPVLVGPGRTGNVTCVGSFPSTDFREIEALLYYLLHEIDLGYSDHFVQSEYPTA